MRSLSEIKDRLHPEQPDHVIVGLRADEFRALVKVAETVEEAIAVLEPITGFFGPRCSVEANKASGLLARALAPLTEDGAS